MQKTTDAPVADDVKSAGEQTEYDRAAAPLQK